MSHAHGVYILGGNGQEPYDIQRIQRALNGVFNRREGNTLIPRPIPAAAAVDLATQALKAINRALATLPTGVFMPEAVTQATRQKNLKANVEAVLKAAKSLPTSAPFPEPERLRTVLIEAIGEYNAALSAKEYVDEKLSFFKALVEAFEELIGKLDRGMQSFENNWKPWVIGAGVLAGTAAVAVIAWKGAEIVKLFKAPPNSPSLLERAKSLVAKIGK